MMLFLCVSGEHVTAADRQNEMTECNRSSADLWLSSTTLITVIAAHISSTTNWAFTSGKHMFRFGFAVMEPKHADDSRSATVGVFVEVQRRS